MKAQSIEQYDSPHQFEPLLPAEAQMGPLLERASDLARAATALGSASGRTAQHELRALLRSMNSYYTQRIEGEHTRPSDIERALQQDFSANADLARKQRLAVAHIRTEALCEEEFDRRLATDGEAGAPWLYSTEALALLHRELFRDLPADDLTLSDGTLLVPGELRQRGVAVGCHEAPAWKSLPRFLARWTEAYAGVRRGEASIVALAAAHHRLAWMHPFLDGNGRVIRLHTHLLLHAAGLTHGLWSPLRGFARTETQYKALLQAADLIDWVRYTLDVCIDQVTFMTQQLDVQGMRDRIRAALAYEAAVVKSGVLSAIRMLARLRRLDSISFSTVAPFSIRATVGTPSTIEALIPCAA